MNFKLTPVAAALLTLASTAHAQTTDDTAERTKTLGTVVITGSQPTSLPTTIPTTIEGIKREKIEKSINATDSEDALKYMPSLLVRKRYIGDYNHAVLSTRASGTGNSARSLVYADGVLLSNLLGNGANFTPRWGLVTPEEIERVDVLYGPFSAAYAGNSVGAVVDYVTRMPKQFEAHAKVGYFVQPFQLYNTNETYKGWQASASLGDRQGPWAWWLNVNRVDSEGQPLTFATRVVSTGTATAGQPAASGAVLETSPLGQPQYILGTGTQYRTVQDHFKAKLAYDINSTVRAAYTFGLWRNKAQGHSASYLRDGSGNAIGYAAPTAATPSPNNGYDLGGRAYTLAAGDFPRTRDTLEHTMHALSVKQRTGGFFDWEVAASLYDYGKDLQRAWAPVTTGAANALNSQAGRVTDGKGTGWHTLAFKAVLRPAPGHVVDAGIQQDTYKLRTAVYASADWFDGSPGAQTSRFDGNTRLRSLYAQDSWHLAERWQAVLGGRAEQWSAWGGVTRGTGAPYNHPERDKTFFSPKAALSFQAQDDWVIKASAGRAYRTPTVSELYQGSVNALGQATNNNPDLKPERSWTSELTSEWRSGTLQLRNTLFFESSRDALYAQLNTATNTNSVQNIDHVRTRGLENAFAVTDLFIKGIDLNASLTYTDSKVLSNSGYQVTPGDTIGKDQIRVPRWRASALVSWRVNDKLTTSLGGRYGSKQFSRLDNTDINGFAYTAASKYAVADLRVHYQFDKQWSAAFGIDNLNNYTYWNFHPYPQRTYSAELKWDL